MLHWLAGWVGPACRSARSHIYLRLKTAPLACAGRTWPTSFKDHGWYFSVEPFSGMSIHGHKPYQFNHLVQRTDVAYPDLWVANGSAASPLGQALGMDGDFVTGEGAGMLGVCPRAAVLRPRSCASRTRSLLPCPAQPCLRSPLGLPAHVLGAHRHRRHPPSAGGHIEGRAVLGPHRGLPRGGLVHPLPRPHLPQVQQVRFVGAALVPNCGPAGPIPATQFVLPAQSPALPGHALACLACRSAKLRKQELLRLHKSTARKLRLGRREALMADALLRVGACALCKSAHHLHSCPPAAGCRGPACRQAI